MHCPCTLWSTKDLQLLKPEQSAPPPKKKKTTEEKTDKKEEGKSKDYHHYRYCPMDGCTALVKRIPPHLKKVHKLLPDSAEYKAALSRVRGPVSDSHRRPYHERRNNPVKDKSGPSVSVEAIEDSEYSEDSDIEVRRRSSHRRTKILDDSESESGEKVLEIEALLKLHTTWLKMSLLNLKPGLDRLTEVSLMTKPANSMESKFPSF